MKQLTCILALFFSFGLSAQSQWVTLYEGGYGTSHFLNGDWDTYHYFENIPGNFSASSSNSWNDSMRKKIMYYLQDFQHGHAGIFRQIDAMADYTSIRVYVDMDLLDSIGTLHYTALSNSVFTDSVNVPIYEEFASGQFGVTVPYDNTVGNNTLYLYVDLLHGDSIYIRFNYIRVEGEIIPPLAVSSSSKNNFSMYSFGNSLFVNPEDENETYHLVVSDLLGKILFEESSGGKKEFRLHTSAGTYFVRVTDKNGGFLQKKVLLE